MHLMSRTLHLGLAICLVSLGSATTSALAGIGFGGQGSDLVLCDLEEFSSFAVGQGAAFVVLRNDVLGISFGQMLAGQTQTTIGGFDVITGSPSGPVMIDETVSASVGVNILPFRGTIIDGLGSVGFPTPSAIGEGAITVVYDQNQSVVAFDVVGANGGVMVAQFFDRSGALLDIVTVDAVASETYVFGNAAGAIAAMTLTNTDFGGVGYDNFVFAPVGTPSPSSSCNAGGPYVVSALDSPALAVLDGRVAADPTGTGFFYTWVSDCPGASFQDRHSAQTTLELFPDGPCAASCTVTLLVDDGVHVNICSTSVAIEGDGGSGTGLICPPDTTVESDGAGNVNELTAWLQRVVGDTVTNDFSGVSYTCGTSGSTTVTWIDTSVPIGGCGVSSCSATFTIVDTVGPELIVENPVIVVDNESCSEWVEVELDPVLVDGQRVEVGETGQDDHDDGDGDDNEDDGADSGGAVDVVVTSDAPEFFPVGDSTIVTYSATDACGNTTTATVEVTVPYNAGVKVTVVADTHGERSHHDEGGTPIPSVTVFAFAVSHGGGSPLADTHDRHLSSVDYAAIIRDCAPVNSAETDADGFAELGLPEGRYVLVAPVDIDGDGLTDDVVGVVTGKIRCGHWKSRRLTVGD